MLQGSSHETKYVNINVKPNFFSLFFKLTCVSFAIYLIILGAESIGQPLTFFLLNLVLSLFLVSLFENKLKFFFLLQPIFTYLSSFWFDIPWREIGVGYAYTHMYDLFTDSSGVDVEAVNERLAMTEANSIFGLGVAYIGTIPQLLLVDTLFKYPNESSYYMSQGTVTLLYASIAAFYGVVANNIKKEILLIPLIIFVASPTFLELNSNLNRYGLLIFGLMLFIISYFGLLSGKGLLHKFISFFILLSSLGLILVSKQTIVVCIILFVLLERFSVGKLFLVSKLFSKISENFRIILIISSIAIVQYLSLNISDFYSKVAFTGAGADGFGGIGTLLSVPILGLVIRLIYAILSPFPFIGFSQWPLYGFNEIFLFVHIFSVFFCSWIIGSFFLNIKRVINAEKGVRVMVLFGVSILCSLALSSVGFHAYLAPAIPFLAVILHQSNLRIMILYPIWFIVLFELLAHAGRI